MQLATFTVRKGKTVQIFALDSDYRPNPGNPSSIRAENRYIPRHAGFHAQCNCEVCQRYRS